MNVINEGNCYIDGVLDALKNGYKIYINGGGAGAEVLYNSISREIGQEFPLTAFLVNDNYYQQLNKKSMMGYPVLPLSDLDPEDRNILLLMGYGHYLFYSTKLERPRFKGIFIGENADPMFCFDKTGDGKYLNWDYFKENEEQFQESYGLWEDEYSRRVQDAYINQKISGKLTCLEDLWECDQYFIPQLVDVSNVNCYVDGGAYNGDSYKAFLKMYYIQTGHVYEGQAFLWEPEQRNFDKLLSVYAGKEKITLINKGMSDKQENLMFSGEGTGGRICEDGNVPVTVDKIDTILSDEKVDFIKMDIEGAEYEALMGAQKVIMRDKPILAVCAYHRRDDLIRIPSLIHSLNPDYRLYLRNHTPYVQELVVYALP